MDYVINIIEKFRTFFGQDMILAIQSEKGKRDLPVTSAEKIAGYLRYCNLRGENILFRPDVSQEDHFLMIDHDAGFDVVQRWHLCESGIWKPGRCIIESSPDNFQVWIKFHKKITVETKRYWLRRMQADPGAGPVMRHGRMPGFCNRKPEHQRPDGSYPMAKLIHMDLQNSARNPENVQKKTHRPPSGGEYIEPRPAHVFSRDISRRRYEGPTESETDIRYVLALIRRGCPDNEIEARILAERQDWHHHNTEKKKKDYLKHTIAKAHSYLGI
jgi:RepB DNA-primase from phage plasmid